MTVIDVNAMTKPDLLARAKEMDISGRHDMTKAELFEAVFGEEGAVGQDDGDEENEDLGTEPTGEFITKEQLVSIKRRKRSTARRDASGKVIRFGTNLSGNTPFRHKYYAIAEEFSGKVLPPAYLEALAAAPMQVQLLIKFMRENGYVDGESCGIGSEIAGLAIKKGYLKTKIDPAHLFAYYRRVMEALGVKEITEFDEE